MNQRLANIMIDRGVVLVFLVFLAGCAGSGARVDGNPIPDWFNQPPVMEGNLVAVGTAVSRDLGIARNQAIAAARVELAQSIETRIEGLTELNQNQAGGLDPQVTQYFNQAAREVMQVDLMGVRTDRTEVMNEGQGFRVYAMVIQDIAAANRALLERMRSQEALYAEFQKTEAFERLNEQIRRYEADREGG